MAIVNHLSKYVLNLRCGQETSVGVLVGDREKHKKGEGYNKPANKAQNKIAVSKQKSLCLNIVFQFRSGRDL